MHRKYRIGEFATRIGRSVSTVRRWEREGRITVKRSASGQRYFDDSDVLAALNPGFDASRRSTVVYCRVSSPGQKSDLESQVKAMELFCLGAGIAVDEWISEIDTGMNLHRREFCRLMDRIEAGEISRLVIAHEDRLARFGFEFIEYLADRHGCEIVSANSELLSPRQELTEDLLVIMRTFSRRLRLLNRYEKELKAELGGSQ
ncbi:IS607 family transposase [Streptomyces sp. NPDC057280]|uniref:IS607 family transposase n=1 Tax=Streptomyces sp. NPDC057280 TaxID=3346081 RepID=UPI0009A43DEC|nr:recombinase [Streptomyces sp. GKU 895]